MLTGLADELNEALYNTQLAPPDATRRDATMQFCRVGSGGVNWVHVYKVLLRLRFYFVAFIHSNTFIDKLL